MSPVQVRPPLPAGSTGRPAVPFEHAPESEFEERQSRGQQGTDVRPKITLACTECKHRNYITKKNRRNDPDRLELKKFCPS